MAQYKAPPPKGWAEDDPNRDVRISDEFNRAMRAMSRYISKYHGNMCSEFQKMDKDQNGALDSFELKEGFAQLGVHVSEEIWKVLIEERLVMLRFSFWRVRSNISDMGKLKFPIFLAFDDF